MSFIDVKPNGQAIKNTRNLPAGMITKQQALEITIDDSYLWDKAFRADLIKQFAFPENKLYEDVYVMYKIFDVAQSFCYVPQPSYYYVVRQDSIVSDMSAVTIADQFASSDEQYRFSSKNIPKLPRKWTSLCWFEHYVTALIALSITIAVYTIERIGLSRLVRLTYQY